MRRKWRGQVARWLGVTALLLGLAPGRADAHGALRRSDPAAGARLVRPLEQLLLEFTEAVETRFVRVTLSDTAGHTIERPQLTFSEDRKIVTVSDAALATLRGPVVVRWSIAGADGHPVVGTIRFRVDARAAEPAAATLTTPTIGQRSDLPSNGAAIAASDAERWGRVDGPVATVLRWAHYVSLLALLGTWSATVLVLPIAQHRFALGETVSATLDGGTRRLSRAAAISFAVVALLRLAAQSDALDATHDAGIGALLAGTAWGRGWSLALAAVASAWWMIESRSRRPALVGVAVGALALGVSQMGHAAAAPQAVAALLTQSAHLLGAGLWIGSLGWLVVVGLAATREHGADRAAVVRAFSSTALGGAALLALSGATNAWRYVGSFEAFTTSTYGRVLLTKLAVLALVVGIGFYNWRAVVPRIETDAGARRLAWSARAELAVALLVLAITARLVVLGPPAFGGP